ncbi:MAG: hypothetical protein IPL92_11950 [Saprospiraceae bacterium]|nr:hypothetical protein [Candidatus Opimibacter iunctus]
MKNIILLLLILTALCHRAVAQVKIGGSGAPDANAVLELDGGTGKGLLLPRLTQSQMEGMSGVPDGMIIFNSTEQSIYCRRSGTWEKFENGSGGNGFSLPHESVHNLTNGYVLNLTNSGTGGAAILGVATNTSGGVFGFSENGIGTLGNSINGTGGYFSSINGAALYLDGEVGIGNITPHSPISLPDSMGRKISLFGPSSAYFGFGVQPGLMQIHADQPSSAIAFGTGTSNAFTEQVRIQGNGNVGIGISSPSTPLSFSNADGNKICLTGNAINQFGIGVKNNTLQFYADQSTSDIAFGYGNSNGFSERMRIKGSGNIGIGTSSPLAKVHSKAFDDKLLLLENANALASNVSARLLFRSGTYFTGSVGTVGTGATSSRLAFYTQATNDPNALLERMAIVNNGNVGINLSNPSSKLEVAGKTKLTKQAGDTEALEVSGKTKLVQQAGEEVALEISGNIRFSGSNPSAFVVTAVNSAYIVLDHPAANGNPDAIILVTARSNYGGSVTMDYNENIQKWMILPQGYSSYTTTHYEVLRCNPLNECVDIPVPSNVPFEFIPGIKFNVLVIVN